MASKYSANVAQAINFLTLPLIITQTAGMVASVQSVLRSTLSAALAPSGGQLTLPFSPSSLPPRPILAACIACDFPWDDWMALLGNRDFDLIIEPHDILVTYFDLSRPYTITVWSEPTHDPMTRPLLDRLGSFDVPHVPISRLGQRARKNMSRKAPVHSTFPRTQTRTVAQQLLEENHKQEADEIFEMISKTSILSPTPTRQEFPTLQLPSLTTGIGIRSALSSPEGISPGGSSRPSSRSSTFSRLSFSDDEGSVTTAFSTSSLDAFRSEIKEPQTLPLDKRSPVFVPSHLKAGEEEESAHVVVDADKKDKVKYLYRGGYTTVVTGGVMLGGGASSASKKADGPKTGAWATGKNKPISLPTPVNKRGVLHGWSSSRV